MGFRQGKHPWSYGQAAAFAVAAIVLGYYALRGGSYDTVVRQTEAVILWLVLGLGFALGLLPRSRMPRGWLIPFAALGLLALWSTFSLTWSDSAERTVLEVTRIAHFAGILLLAWSTLDRESWRPALAGLAFGAVVVCALAVASRLAPDAFPANDVKRVFGTNRLNYPFFYWNAVGAWSAMAIAMALAWSSHARLLVTRLAASAALPVCALADYLTYSRAGVAGALLAVGVVVALARNRWVAAVHAIGAGAGAAVVILAARNQDSIVEASDEVTGAGAVVGALVAGGAIAVLPVLVTWAAGADRWRLERRLGALLTALGAILVAVVLVTVVRDDVRESWDQFRGASLVRADTGPGSDPASRLTNLQSGRYEIWKSSLRAFDSAELKGVAAGGFEFWWNQDGGQEYVRDAHSLYLEQLAELGLPGLLLVLAALFGLAGLAFRARIAATEPEVAGAVVAGLAALIVWAFHAGVDWMWESTAVTVLALGGAALASGAMFRPGQPVIALRIAVPIIAALALAVQLPGLVSTSKVRESQSAFRSGDIQGALLNATEAAEAEPWAAAPLMQRALVEESIGRLEAAAADLRRAVDREPTHWRPRLFLARVEAQRGRVQAALEALRAARRLRPEAAAFEASEG